MKIKNKSTVQNIKIDAQQVIVGDKNTVQSIAGNDNPAHSITSDNGAKNKQEKTTLEVIIDSDDSNKSPPPQKSNRNKLKAIIAAIGTFCTISGISVLSIYNCVSNGGKGSSVVAESSGTNDLSEASNLSETGERSEAGDSSSEVESYTESESSSKNDITSEANTQSDAASSSSSLPFTDYKIFLYSEYSKIIIYGENNMTATLNFDADKVIITAYLASGKVDSLTMNRKNSTEWCKKVEFNETGIHKIVATAVAPDGRTIEGTTEIEVIPINFGDYNLDQLFPTPN